MQTTQSILLFVIYTFFNINPVSLHEALVVIQESVLSDDIKVRLPREAKESENGSMIYPEIEQKNKISYRVCPHKPDVTEYLKNTANMYPDDVYCLMNSFTSDCEQEVMPLFTKTVNERYTSTECGSSVNYDLYRFGFNYCRSTEINIVNPRPVTSELLSLYDVCFDPANSKTIWTKHNVQTESMLIGGEFKSQQMTEEEATLSTDYFSLQHKHDFSKTADKYKNQKPDLPHRMIPQMLVPKEDMALKLWKKTTTHYLNTSALWYKLEPLMGAINNGIRKLAVSAQLEYKQKVDIYTTTHSPFSLLWRFLNKVQRFFFLKNESEDWNIWCKFIHVPSMNQAMMIYLHNTPDNPPENVNSTPENENKIPANTQEDTDHAQENPNSKHFPKECTKPVICDFRKWSQNPGNLSDDLLEYAYCCEVDKGQVKRLFNVNLEGNLELLDIDKFYEKYQVYHHLIV